MRTYIDGKEKGGSSGGGGEADFTTGNTTLVNTVEKVSGGHSFRFHMVSQFNCKFTVVLANGTVKTASPDVTYTGVVSVSWSGSKMARCSDIDGTGTYRVTGDKVLVKSTTDAAGRNWTPTEHVTSFSGSLASDVAMLCEEE